MVKLKQNLKCRDCVYYEPIRSNVPVYQSLSCLKTPNKLYEYIFISKSFSVKKMINREIDKLINMKMLQKVFIKTLFQMEQNIPQYLIHEVNIELNRPCFRNSIYN